MDETSRFSISVNDLYSRLGTANEPVLVDVRREPALGEAEVLIVGAIRFERGMVIDDALYTRCRSEMERGERA